jgi:hypothetical protein
MHVLRTMAWLGSCVLLGAVACGSDTTAPPGSSSSGTGGDAGSAGTAGSASGGSGGSDVDASGTGGSGGSAGGAGGSGGSGDAAGGTAGGAACTRESLKNVVDRYFEALSAHTPSSLPLAAGVKFTENGVALELGAGLWSSAGALKFKHSAFDTEACSTVTESVVADGDTDIPYGLRLKLVDQEITEIESIAVRSGDYFVASNTAAMIASESEGWETTVPENERATREELAEFVEVYFERFPAGGCNFASDCQRLENGFSLRCSVGLSCSTSGSGSMAMTPRLQLYDVEAGIGAGFVMFAGSYTDFHLFKVRGGQVRSVHAILARADAPGW